MECDSGNGFGPIEPLIGVEESSHLGTWRTGGTLWIFVMYHMAAASVHSWSSSWKSIERLSRKKWNWLNRSVFVTAPDIVINNPNYATLKHGTHLAAEQRFEYVQCRA